MTIQKLANKAAWYAVIFIIGVIVGSALSEDIHVYDCQETTNDTKR